MAGEVNEVDLDLTEDERMRNKMREALAFAQLRENNVPKNTALVATKLRFDQDLITALTPAKVNGVKTNIMVLEISPSQSAILAFINNDFTVELPDGQVLKPNDFGNEIKPDKSKLN